MIGTLWSQIEANEISRILKLGHVGWSQDPNGVIIKSNREGASFDKISFPEDSYDDTDGDLDSFWVSCRAQEILKTLREYKQDLLWEIGAGDGKVAIPLKRNGISMVTAEPLYDGAKHIAAQGIPTFAASLIQLLLPRESIKTIGIFDVLEHIEDPSHFLAELKRILQEGGMLFVTVPAHQWLFSDFDISIGHYKRYSRKSLDRELISAGFEPLMSKYFFASLVLPAFFLRRVPYLLGRRRIFSGESGVSESSRRQMNPNRVVNFLAKTLLRLDSRLKLPFGLSIIGVYRSS